MAAAAAAPLTGGASLAQAPAQPAAQKAPTRNTPPPTITELCAGAVLVDCALSHDGRTIAVLRHVAGPDGKRAAFITLHPFDNLPASKTLGVPETIRQVEWVNDERLAVYSFGTSYMMAGVQWTVHSTQLGFLDREGKAIDMTTQSFARKALVFGGIVDLLPDDPKRIIVRMMSVATAVQQLYHLDVYDQSLTLIDRGQSGTLDWMCQDANPIVRLDASRSGKVISLMRKEGEGSWTLVRKIARTDFIRPDFDMLAPSEEPGIVYVAARTEGDTVKALHRFDLATDKFVGLVSRRADRDVEGVNIDKFGRFLGTVYVDDKVAYDLSDKTLGPTLEALNGLYGGANVRIWDISKDRNRLVAHIEGPKHAGAFVLFDPAKRSLAMIGDQKPWLNTERLAPMTSLDIKTRDGATIRAYLTDPGGSGARPMVVLPHGGPEVRDQIGFDLYAQALAAQGWLVLQPNFRGSGGYGQAFAEAGHRRWNGRVSEDIEDAADQVIASGRADPTKVAIMGSSFGGYAALMAGARKPDFWRGVVSIAGVSDLDRMLREERSDGEDSPIYQHWVKRIGDPKTDAAAIADASPIKHVEKFKVPVLMIHGAADWIVPIEQSRIMQRALRRAGKEVELIELRGEGHGGFDSDVNESNLKKIVVYLKKQFETA